MKTAVLERWLIKETLSDAILNVPVGLICLVASLIVLAFSTLMVWLIGFILFQIIAVVVKSSLDYNLFGSTLFCEILCLAFLVWLFVSHFQRNAELFRQSRFRTASVHVSGAGLSRASYTARFAAKLETQKASVTRPKTSSAWSPPW